MSIFRTDPFTRGRDLSGSLQGGGGIGGLLARTDGANSQSACYHADGNGNIMAMVNAQQIVVARYTYDPFGNILSKSGPLADANTYRFSSQEYHQPSGLSLYLYRAYDPNLQRWLNRDPIGEWGGINLYQYCLNNPVEWGDPFGLDVPKGGTVLMHLNDGHPAGYNPVGILWNLPNSALGALWGGLGIPFGAKPSFGNNALQFENHPFQFGGDITLGNVICYRKGMGPKDPFPPGTPYTYGDHERQHTKQGELLGPLYLPAYGIGAIGGMFSGGSLGPGNFMEAGPYLPLTTWPPMPPKPWP